MPDRREINGLVKQIPLEGTVVETNPATELCWTASELLDGFGGKRVKIVIEVIGPGVCLEDRLRELFARRGVSYEFSKKYTAKNELTTMFATAKNTYWTVVATIPPTWKTVEEHDNLFYDATEVALDSWLKARV